MSKLEGLECEECKRLVLLKCMKIHASVEEEIRLLQIRFKKEMGTL